MLTPTGATFGSNPNGSSSAVEIKPAIFSQAQLAGPAHDALVDRIDGAAKLPLANLLEQLLDVAMGVRLQCLTLEAAIQFRQRLLGLDALLVQSLGARQLRLQLQQ